MSLWVHSHHPTCVVALLFTWCVRAASCPLLWNQYLLVRCNCSYRTRLAHIIVQHLVINTFYFNDNLVYWKYDVLTKLVIAATATAGSVSVVFDCVN
jgi:hypothetical protein